MKDLTLIKKGITHSGRFHTDDVMCAAFLRTYNPNIIFERVADFEGPVQDDELVFDVGLGEFDHHQENKKVDDRGIPYCAFGLLWETYGRDYLKRNSFSHIDEAFSLFKKKYLSLINKGDNYGYKNLRNFSENKAIIRCNPFWFESADDQSVQSSCFETAISLGSAILGNWIRTIFSLVETSYEA